jgi:predicted secreted protein
MKKFLAWLSAAFAMLVGIYFASNAKAQKQKAQRLTAQQIKHEQIGKISSLETAAMFEVKADAAMDKAAVARSKSVAKQHELEKRDATNMADRVRAFNDGLRDDKTAD